MEIRNLSSEEIETAKLNSPSMYDFYEFRPDYYEDVKNASEEYLDRLFKKPEWESRYLQFTHNEQVSINGRKMDLEEYSQWMERFKADFLASVFFNWTIESIDLHLAEKHALVKGFVTSGSLDRYAFRILFRFDYLWYIHEIGLDMIRMGAGQ